MSVASLAASFSSLMTFTLVGSTTYSGSNLASTSTPSLFLGRSRTCPIDAITLKSRPRYLLIVFAFAGDSTMTSDLAIPFTNSRLVKFDKAAPRDPGHAARDFEGAQFGQEDGRRQAGRLGQLVHGVDLSPGH